MNTRRKFLATAATGSVGIVLPARNIAESASTCLAKASPADAIESHLKLIGDLKFEELFQTTREVINTSIECNKLLKQLSDLVKRLEEEISKTDRIPLKNHVSRMGHLTNRNRLTLQLGVTSDTYVTNPIQLSYISEELKEKAEDLLPPGKHVLSAEAARILNDIIKLVRDSAPVRKKLEIQQSSADTKANKIRADFKKAEDLLEAAIDLIDAADKQSPAQAEVSRSTASQNVTDAVAIIKSLTIDPGANKGAAESAAVVITLLEGVAYWINNPAEMVTPGVTRSGERVDFVNASFRSYDPHVVGLLVGTLEDALASFCTRNSMQQLAVLITGLLLPLTGWKHARRFIWRQPVSSDEKITEIEKSLRSWRRSVQKTCGQNADLAAMAKALEPFV